MKKILVLGLLLASATANAGVNGYLGGAIGPSFVNDDFGTRVIGAGEAGLKPYPELGLGIYVSTEELSSVGDTSMHETVIGFMPKYFFNGDASGPFVGGIIGAGILSNDTNRDFGFKVNTTTSSFAIAPAAGYAIVVLPHLTIDPQANYTIVTGTGGSDAINALNLLMSVKFTW